MSREEVREASDRFYAAINVFRREDGVWKLLHHHVDLLPNVAAAFQNALAHAS